MHARGLLRHQLTRIYLRDTGDAAPRTRDAGRAARRGRLRFDIRMQGDAATVFFEL